MTGRSTTFNAVAIAGVWSAVAVAYMVQDQIKAACRPMFEAWEYSYLAYTLCFIGWLAMPEPSPPVVVISALVVFYPPHEAWATFMGSFEDYQKVVAMMTGVFVIMYWTNGLMLLGLEHFFSEKLERYRIQDPKAATRRPGTGKLVFNVLINTCIVPLIALAIGLSVTFKPSDFLIPGPLEMFCSTLACVLINEISFFYGHWLFHANKFLYGNIHKIHHEFKSPTALAAVYCHPIELVISDFGPLGAGIIMFNKNLYFAAVFTAFAVLGTQTHHCGFRWPWIASHGNQPDYHDYHHEKFNCNYGNMGFMDALHGTGAGSRRHPPVGAGAAKAA